MSKSQSSYTYEWKSTTESKEFSNVVRLERSTVVKDLSDSRKNDGRALAYEASPSDTSNIKERFQEFLNSKRNKSPKPQNSMFSCVSSDGDYTFVKSNDLEEIAKKLASGEGSLIELSFDKSQRNASTMFSWKSSQNIAQKIEKNRGANTRLRKGTYLLQEPESNVQHVEFQRPQKPKKSWTKNVRKFVKRIKLPKILKSKSDCRKYEVKNRDFYTQTSEMVVQEEKKKKKACSVCSRTSCYTSMDTCTECKKSEIIKKQAFQAATYQNAALRYVFPQYNQMYQLPKVMFLPKIPQKEHSLSCTSDCSLCTSSTDRKERSESIIDKRRVNFDEPRRGKSIKNLRILMPKELANETRKRKSMRKLKDEFQELQKGVAELQNKLQIIKTSNSSKDVAERNSIKSQLMKLCEKIDFLSNLHGKADRSVDCTGSLCKEPERADVAIEANEKVDAAVECVLKVNAFSEVEKQPDRPKNLLSLEQPQNVKTEGERPRRKGFKFPKFWKSEADGPQNLLNRQRDELAKIKDLIQNIKEEIDENPGNESQKNLHFWYTVPKRLKPQKSVSFRSPLVM